MVKKNLKGGNSLLSLTPADYKGVGDLAVAGDANYVKQVAGYSSNQVGGRRRRSGSKRSGHKCSHKRSGRKCSHKRKQSGGMGYGFANSTDVPVVAGSYFPVTPTCSGKLDVSRGGNNFIGGGQSGGALLLGGARGGALLLGGVKSKKSRKSKKSSKSKKNKTQKWWQVGCKKLMGGFIPM